MILEGDALAEWLSSRAGKLTASRMCDAMDFRKDGKPSASRTKYMHDLLAERVTGDSVRHYVTDAMRWGLEREAEAKLAYETATGDLIGDCLLFDHPRIDSFSSTPDGLLGGDGLLETKCPTSGVYVEWVLAGVVPEAHKPQMIAQCATTGRKWVEFVAFDPRVKDPRRRLFIRRFTPTAEEIAAVEAAAEKFLAELDRLFELFTEQAA